MQIVLIIATILGGIAAVWFFWDKFTGAKTDSDRKGRQLLEQDKRDFVRAQLGNFITTGEALVRQCYRNQAFPLPESEISEWTAKVEKFLGDYLGQDSVARFTSDAGIHPQIPDPMYSNSHRMRVIWINRRLTRLNEFLAEQSKR